MRLGIEKKVLKGYLRYKSIFCHKVVLDDVYLKNVLSRIYFDFWVSLKSTNCKICDVIIDIAA